MEKKFLPWSSVPTYAIDEMEDTGNSKPSARYWALLIGINFYRKPTESLEGCVHDVEKVKVYLENCLFSIQTKTFTATVPVDPTSQYPSEGRSSWPTLHNITSALQEITDAAKAGDFVYIHYSGHGAPTKPETPYSHYDTGDLSFVLFDEFHGRRYLRGSKFAEMVNEMVKKGLLVNIVLDCCFSAGVVRKGDLENTRVRTTRHAHDIDTPASPSLSANTDVQTSKIHRNSSIIPTWLIKPDGYTILTACGVDEIAIELRTQNGQMTGALTHFMLLALASLQRSCIEISQQSLYSYLLVQFQLHRPTQNPNLYGNSKLSFFGKLLAIDTVFVSVIWRDHRLFLEAGEAQGVCKDDEYMLSAFESPEIGRNRATDRSIKVFVEDVGSLTSILMPTPDEKKVDSGWKAELVTPFSSKEVIVRFPPEIVNGEHWLGVEKASQMFRFHTDDNHPRPYTYTVNINGSGHYEILDQEDQALPWLPALSKDERDSAEAVMGVLNHISKFKSIENIENRSSNASFNKRFKIHMEGPDQPIQEGTGVLNVKELQIVKLVIQNYGSSVLYAYIYNLDSSWGITNVFPGASHWSIPAKNDAKGFSGKKGGEFKMRVPDHFKNVNYLSCRDVFKVFITSRPIPFNSIQMAAFCDPSSKRGETTRGDPMDVMNLLLGIGPTSRGEGKAAVEEWTSHNFVVHTTCETESS